MIRSACRPASFINLAKGFKNLRVCSTLASSSDTPKINVAEHVGSVTDASVPTEPIMRKLASYPLGTTPKQAWLDTLSCIEHKKLGLLELHPDIFGTYPRIDILWENFEWQKMYRKVDYRFEPNRAELRGGGRKPWPQKGTGRARHGSIRSPLFVGGGKVHGPRGPKTYFSILDTPKRVLGLRVALTYKHAQNNLHIVEDFNLPTSDPQYLEDLIESKGWGLSVLFIDDCDIMPENITIAASEHDAYNIMPLYGLNVWSMLLHETLVLTRSALESLESKLLQHVNAEEWRIPKFSKTRGDVRMQS